MKGISKKHELALALIVSLFFVFFVYNLIHFIYDLNNNGVIANARVVKVIEKGKGNTSLGKIIPSTRHLLEVDGKEITVGLQERREPGDIKIKWLPDRPYKAIALNSDESYSFFDLIGGWIGALILTVSSFFSLGFFLCIYSIIKSFRRE